MKIGFLPYSNPKGKRIAPGTRLRVINLAKHLDCIVSQEPEKLRGCDVVIFQGRFLPCDVKTAKELK